MGPIRRDLPIFERSDSPENVRPTQGLYPNDRRAMVGQVLIIEKPDGTIVEKGFAARQDGTFDEQITLDDTWEPGRYVVKTTYQGEEVGAFSFFIDMERVPEWVKNNAEWWSEGLIGDSDFISGLQFLINQDIMKIPSTSQGTGSGTDDIPGWIKNNAGWWADGLISDKDFVSGIQFLIENGIMKIAN